MLHVFLCVPNGTQWMLATAESVREREGGRYTIQINTEAIELTSHDCCWCWFWPQLLEPQMDWDAWRHSMPQPYDPMLYRSVRLSRPSSCACERVCAYFWPNHRQWWISMPYHTKWMIRLRAHDLPLTSIFPIERHSSASRIWNHLPSEMLSIYCELFSSFLPTHFRYHQWQPH